MGARFECQPLTLDRWSDVEALFGPKGACGGCWCMYWRVTHAVFEAQKGVANKRAFKRVVRSGPPPGLIAYDGDSEVNLGDVMMTPGKGRQQINTRSMSELQEAWGRK